MKQNYFQKRPMPPDQIFQSFSKGLYRITGQETTDSILDILSAPGANNSTNVQTSTTDVGSGVASSTATVAAGATQQGKSTFDNSVAGFILGVDASDGLAKFYIGNSTKYINWDGMNLTIVGGVSISQLNIPDTITANSFHVDTTGNTWWGATTLGASTASVLNTGVATFTSVTVNGSTLAFQQDFGDGSDGSNSTLSGTLSRDMFYTTVVITGTLNTNGYRIFASVSCRVANGGIAQNNGGAGDSAGNGGAGGAGGSLPAGIAGVNGPVGGTGTSNPIPNAGHSGTTGTSVTHSVGAAGTSNGGTGGDTGQGGGGAGSGGTVTAGNNSLHASITGYLFYDGSTQMSLSASSGSGGSGGGGIGRNSTDVGGSGGKGGGAGGQGGVVWIASKSITIDSGGIVQALGGNGGNGQTGNNASGGGNPGSDGGSGGGGGGGGAGGQGGVVFLKYSSYTNNGSVLVTAGSGGSGGVGGQGVQLYVGTGPSGTGGGAGNAGSIVQIQV